jgi:hypothetical protein
MKTQIGKLITGDLIESTLTFEIKDDMGLQAGTYAIVPLDEYQKLMEISNPSAVKECKPCISCDNGYCDKKKFKVSVNATWCPDFKRSVKNK